MLFSANYARHAYVNRWSNADRQNEGHTFSDTILTIIGIA